MFRSIVSTGVFTTGHGPANAWDELTRITKRGGHLIFTVGTTVWQEAGFAEKFDELCGKGLIAPVEVTPVYHPIYPLAPARLRSLFEQGVGRRYEEIPWYQALAGYRLACIACLNVKLHRRGQRHDPAWEKIGLGVMPMFSRAQTILATL